VEKNPIIFIDKIVMSPHFYLPSVSVHKQSKQVYAPNYLCSPVTLRPPFIWFYYLWYYTMVLYYVKQINETSQLRVVPTLFESGLRFGDYDGIIEIDLSTAETAALNNMFFYRNNEYAVEAEYFRYPLDTCSMVSVPPPPNHTPYKDIATGIMEQMAFDITGNINDIASFENIAELRHSVDDSIKGMFKGQRYKLARQGTKANPIDSSNSIVHSLIEQFNNNENCPHPSPDETDDWKTFQFRQGDCLAFNLTFLSPGNLNKPSWCNVAKNKKGTNLTYSIRLKFSQCWETNLNTNAETYDGYGMSNK
jgi:hypothetical protein